MKLQEVGFMKKAGAFYSIFMGVCMIGMWIVFYISGGIPEIHIKPVELGMHIMAEIITAVLLVIGGLGLLLKRNWGRSIYMLSMGMLFYTLIMSPGYFLQQGEMGFAIMFGAFTIIALIFTTSVLRNKRV